MQVLLTFVTGVLTGMSVSAAGVFFNRWNDKRKKEEQLLFQIYMQLLELRGWHVWIAATESGAEGPSPEHRGRFSDLRWRIADILRQADKVQEVPEILRAMFSVGGFPTEKARAAEMDRLLGVIGNRLNPRYNQAMEEISAQNQRMMRVNMDEYFDRQKRLGG